MTPKNPPSPSYLKKVSAYVLLAALSLQPISIKAYTFYQTSDSVGYHWDCYWVQWHQNDLTAATWQSYDLSPGGLLSGAWDTGYTAVTSGVAFKYGEDIWMNMSGEESDLIEDPAYMQFDENNEVDPLYSSKVLCVAPMYSISGIWFWGTYQGQDLGDGAESGNATLDSVAILVPWDWPW